ncbi:MAG: fructose-specific PTS transporter subunit EIIC [Firmicutes bacterium]|nr:fructose-specific PTS transporter subunit EIIC [Bacillota bacterium]
MDKSISTILQSSCIDFCKDLTKKEVFDKLASMHKEAGNILDDAGFLEDIGKREAQGNTCVGDGICIPHAKSKCVQKPGLALVIAKEGIEADAPDKQACNLFFMIAAPDTGDFHLDTLSGLMRMLMDEDFKKSLLGCETATQVLSLIESKENNKQESVEQKEGTQKYFLAVTACPTGIAHTYMAAEKLESTAKEMGVYLKAETNGSGGAKNVLTDEEIQKADAIIIAADTTVQMARFEGKPLIKVKVSDGIRKAKSILQDCIDGKAVVYHHQGSETKETKSQSKESFGRTLYKHLMSGVSHMLPFVIGGGICIALAFLIDTIAGSPQDGGFGSYNAVASWFKTLGGAAFGFMLPVLAGYIAYSIADRPGLMVGFVGGALAINGQTFRPESVDFAWVGGGFLGALLAGFLAGYLLLYMRKAADKVLPKSLEGIKPVLIYPLVGLILIGVVMSAINPIMGVINEGLNKGLSAIGTKGLVGLGILLGAMMAVDMGGPINKAAYVFGTGLLASQTPEAYQVMAAVMIGGMVPPIAIALSTTFFKSRWTPNERKGGPVNYIMGLSFITEGAIPYAANDPARVIPSLVVGSGVAGGLSMLFKASLQAPHGGIFVFAVVGNWYWYLLALAAGSVAGMFMLMLLKKKQPKVVSSEMSM